MGATFNLCSEATGYERQKEFVFKTNHVIKSSKSRYTNQNRQKKEKNIGKY